jgi:hypothetical protein
VVSLALFILFLPAIVAIALGVVAWVRIRRAGGRITGRAMAGIGAGLGLLSLVLASVFVGVLANSHLFDGPLRRYTSLRPGDCFSAPSGLLRAMNVLQVVDCTKAHDREVAGLVVDPSSSSDPYPGSPALIDEANRACPQQVHAYAGTSLDSTKYLPWFYYPRETNWDRGDRVIVCTVRSLPGKAVGSVRAGAPPASA